MFAFDRLWINVVLAMVIAACTEDDPEPSAEVLADASVPSPQADGSTGTPEIDATVAPSEADSAFTMPEFEDVPLVAADVSFLIPLRAVESFSASTEGGHGTLLPRSYFDQLEALTRVDEPDTLYAHLDVVGVRLDPCFVEAHQTDNCESQVRLVLQPVIDTAESFVARDATIHAFYQVPLGELHALAQSIARLRLDSDGAVLIGQHAQASAVATLLVPVLGAERLSRLTFVSVHASDEAWSFGGVDVRDGMLTHHALFGVDDHEQHLTSLGGTETLDASILPEPVIETEAARFLERFVRDDMTAEEKASAKAGLQRMLDPSVHDTGTVDCASCHMATPAAYFVEGQLGLSIPDVYANTQNQRMFGYFGIEESISPRVHAETDVVLDAFERLR